MIFLQRFKTIRISGLAKKDLIEIGTYTKQNWGNSQKHKYLKQLKKLFQTIRDNPETGMARDDVSDGLRAHPLQKHIVFYRQTKNELVIVRVFHHRMDIIHHFNM